MTALTASTSTARGTARRRSSSIALLSTYPPTQCGLATFTQALHAELVRTVDSVGVVRVLDRPLTGGDPQDAPEVVDHLVNGSPTSGAAARHTLDGYGTVIVQHEYGIYGGPDGADVVELVEALTAPVIVVLHTVLAAPSARQREILVRLAAAADVVVAMTATGRRRLREVYDVPADRVRVIPHGAIDHRSAPRRRPLGRRPLVLTWGLLGPGKGIEWAIDAMPGLRDLRPRYLVAGETHPKVLERDGEAYRTCLAERIAARGVADLVEVDPSYLGLRELANLIECADVVLLPYDSPDQVTSGVLIEAVAAGRPVVSTAFPHAIELLAGGAGLVVPRQDPDAIGAALRRVLSEPGLSTRMAAQAASEAPELVWAAVAERYRQLAVTLVAAGLAAVS